MASLVGVVTALTLSGVPGHLPFIEQGATAGAHTGSFTRLGLGGYSRPIDAIPAKDAAAQAELNVTDTASLSATEGPLDSNEIITYDTARLSAVDVSNIYNFYTLTDTARLFINEAVTLNVSGVTDNPATDTASISATEVATVDVTVDVTDTASLQTTDTPTVDTAGVVISVTDTASLSTTDTAAYDAITGVAYLTGEDQALLRVVDTAVVTVDRKISAIAISYKAPKIVVRKL